MLISKNVNTFYLIFDIAKKNHKNHKTKPARSP